MKIRKRKIRKRIKSRKLKIRRENWKSGRNWGQLKVRRNKIRKKTGKSGEKWKWKRRQNQEKWRSGEKNENQEETKDK